MSELSFDELTDLDPKQLAELLGHMHTPALVQVLERLKATIRKKLRTRIDYYFATPEIRAMYPKQMQFFALGKQFQERGLFGGNRCLTPWTIIPTDRGERQVGEVLGEGSFGVQTWDGDSQQSTLAGPVFLKSIEPAFRIHLDNGQVFECSRRHRVLSREGWTSVARLTSRADVLRWSCTPSGWRASCVVDGHLHGLLPLRVAGIVEGQSHRLSDVPSIDPNCSLAGATASTLVRTRVCRTFDRRATPGDLLPASVLIGTSEWGAPAPARSVLPTFQEAWCDDRSPEGSALRIAAWQSEILQSLPGCAAVFLPCASLSLVGGVKILALEEIGVQPIVDFEVPGMHNYVAAGAVHHNSGKTLSGTYEDVKHLTGLYPDWWEGYRFNRPISAWAAGDTGKTTRDVLQLALLGQPGDSAAFGTGMIPGDLILRTTVKHGLADAVETIFVRHVPSGGVSTLQLKSYDQGREAFQGTAQDLIHLDEEPDLDIYIECLLRLMTTDGRLVLTATPLRGLTELMLQYLPELAPIPSEPEKVSWSEPSPEAEED